MTIIEVTVIWGCDQDNNHEQEGIVGKNIRDCYDTDNMLCISNMDSHAPELAELLQRKTALVMKASNAAKRK